MFTYRTFFRGAAACLLLTSPAFAHAHLRGEEPAAGSTVSATPSLLKLMFSEGVELSLTGIEVAKAGVAVPTGTPTLEGDGKVLDVPVQKPLEPGVYTVTWHALAKDGHSTHGEYSFTIAK
jgi:methionine-rich copper-binding protein CopC